MAKGIYLGVRKAQTIEKITPLNLADYFKEVSKAEKDGGGFDRRLEYESFWMAHNSRDDITGSSEWTLFAKFDCTLTFYVSVEKPGRLNITHVDSADAFIEEFLDSEDFPGDLTGEESVGGFNLKKDDGIKFIHSKPDSSDGSTITCLIRQISCTYYTDISGKVKFCYVGGMQSVAQIVKKAYIGIGGVARLCYSLPPPFVSKGYAESLSNTGTEYMGAASNGSYAFFAGGYNRTYGKTNDEVSAYSTDATKLTPAKLSVIACNMSSGRIKNYAVFAGGKAYGASMCVSTVTYYNESGSQQLAPLLSTYKFNVACANVSDTYIIFAGGMLGGGGSCSTGVDVYTDSMTAYGTYELSQGTIDVCGASVGNYALFASGYYYNGDPLHVPSCTVDAYNQTLTRSTAPSLTVHKADCSTASTDDYAMFASSKSVECYNKVLTKTEIAPLNQYNDNGKGVYHNGYALFSCGEGDLDYGSDIVDIYKGLTKMTGLSLKHKRYEGSLASIGNYVLAGGGCEDDDIECISSVEMLGLI